MNKTNQQVLTDKK